MATERTLPENAFLCEATWEVCNKIGGIHTVLASKIVRAQQAFADNYVCVGPYLSQNPAFHETDVPEPWQPVRDELAGQGIGFHFGTWITDGDPTTILLSFEGLLPQLDSYKGRFWEKFGIETLGIDYWDIGQPLVWSIAVAKLLQAMHRNFADKQLIFHGHEWWTAGTFMTLSLDGASAIKTTFTTHATVLGRALTAQGTDIYTNIDSVNPDEAAKKYNVVTKHQLEAIAANLSTVFTTVSDLTGREATAFLKRTPTLITENGLDSTMFPAFDELCVKHKAMRQKLHEFVTAYFFPSYQFNLHRTTYQFTMGRYELHNKGYDLYLQSLGELNTKLKSEDSDSTIVAFLFVPGDARRLRPEVSFQLAARHHISRMLREMAELQHLELYRHLWTNEGISSTDTRLLPKSLRSDIDQILVRLPKYEAVPVSPYDLGDPEHDGMLTCCRKFGLENREEDRVKVVLVPTYLDGFDQLFRQSLYDLVAGCDLGVFPSLYEPWGYTPMESLAMGVPAVTSDLAGFGLAIQSRYPESKGAIPLKREGLSDDVVLQALTEMLERHLRTRDRERLSMRMAAYDLVQHFDWKELYQTYVAAYSIGLSTPEGEVAKPQKKHAH